MSDPKGIAAIVAQNAPPTPVEGGTELWRKEIARANAQTSTSLPIASQAMSNNGSQGLPENFYGSPAPDGETLTAQIKDETTNDKKITATGDAKLLDANTVKWQSNILSDYQNVSYSFTLAACGDDTDVNTYAKYEQAKSNALNNIDNANSYVILAQTGSTKYNITEVDIENKCGNGMFNNNSAMTSMTMKITEPYGLSLMDSFKNTNEVLKIHNYSKMFYFVELHFNAYTDDGLGQTLIGFSGSDRDRAKFKYLLWRVRITTIDTQVDESGAKYTIHMVPANEVAFDTYIYRFSGNIKTTGNTTGDAIDNLAKILNDDVKARYLGRQQYEYSFEVAPSLRGFRLKTDFPYETNTSDKNPSSDKIEHQVSKGTTVGQMLDSLFMNSTMVEEYEKLHKDPKNSKNLKFCELINVHAEIELGKYDPIIGDYEKKVKYMIYPYRTNQFIAGQAHYDEMKTQQVEILKEMMAGKFLCKKYDYLYTGLNTEVLGFDIKFNMAYSSVVAMFDGTRRGYAAVSTGPVYNERLVATLQTFEQQLDQSALALQAWLKTNYNDSNGDTETASKTKEATSLRQINTIRESVQALQQELSSGTLEKAASQKKISATAEFNDRVAKLQQQALAPVEAAREAENTRLNNVLSSYAKDEKGGVRFRNYAEDITNRAARNFKEDVQPLTFHRTPQDVGTQYGSGSLGDWNLGKSVMGNALNQVYGPAEKEMQKVTLDIRGDPYWFTPTNMEAPIKIDTKISDETGLLSQLGEHNILITFRYPITTNEDKNEIILSGSETFNGVYGVKEVNHTFTNGVFKQTLSCYRQKVIIVDKTTLDTLGVKDVEVLSGGQSTVVQPAGDPPAASPQQEQAIATKQAEVSTKQAAVSSKETELAGVKSQIAMARNSGDSSLMKELQQKASAVEGQLSEAKSGLASAMNELNSTIASVQKTITDSIKDVGTQAWDAAKSAGSYVVDETKNLFS